MLKPVTDKFQVSFRKQFFNKKVMSCKYIIFSVIT